MKPTYEELEDRHAKIKKVLAHILAEKTGLFFICGDAGEKDDMGLPEKILVCPSYGLDGFAMYKKEREYSAPGW
jgi:hypothetical protein